MSLLDKASWLFDKICDWGERNPDMVGFIFIMAGLCIIWFCHGLVKKQNTAAVAPAKTNEELQMTPIAQPNSERRITRSQTRAATTSPEGLRQRTPRTPGTLGYASTSSPGVNRWSSYVDEPSTSTRRPQYVPQLNLSGVEPEIPTDEQIKKKKKRTDWNEWFEEQKY